ncbi:DUF4292 domain-containing protein [Parabacteroides sp. PF5-6]|uniref:DUF4292 domain-containing protein n=1 Tax=Parabacteroides sp. PF5-6 TaxID=1742403 RepID=UPI002406D2BA|nr:DUF4292 domain-containing protein [Parabacteroides sp. PF5-6]MDF9831341.1 hypothetical protein [Parabacteroides sp. PF5-6]
MKNVSKYIVFCVALYTAMLFVLFGCKSSQKVATVEAGEAKAHAEFFDSMQERAFRFETLSARMNAEILIPGKEMSSRVDLKMVRDSAFILSVQPALGIEIFRLFFDQDSVKIIDRMSRRYLAESHVKLKGQMPVGFNYNNLQSLFVNHLFYPGENRVAPALYHRFLLNQEGNSAEIRAKDAMGLSYLFTADGEEKLLSTYVTDKAENFALQWIYSDFRITEEQPFPMRMDINLFAEKASKGGLRLNFSRVQTNIPVQIEVTIPEKYKRVTFAEIMKMFGSSNE